MPGTKSLARSRRALLWRIRFIRLRQAVRAAYDLTALGTGSLERISSALIVGIVFFLPCLPIAHIEGFGKGSGLALATCGLAGVVLPSAMLIPRSTDEALAARLHDSEGRLGVVVEEMARQSECEAQYQEQPCDAQQWQPQSPDAGIVTLRKWDGPKPVAEVLPARSSRERCPYCREVIQAGALKCRYRGEYLDEWLRKARMRERGGQVVLMI
jgi:hypothetical protein